MEGAESVARHEQGRTTNEMDMWTDKQNQRKSESGEEGGGRCGWMGREKEHLSEHFVAAYIKFK